MTKTEWAFLMQKKDEIECAYIAHFQKYGHDAETCILKAEHVEVCNKLDEVTGGKK